MGQDMIDQFRGVKDVNLCTASSCRQSQLRAFQHLYYKKMFKVITLTCSRKKGLNTYLRTVSLSNGIWYAKLLGYWAKQKTFLQK